MSERQEVSESPRVAVLSPYHNREGSVEGTFQSIHEQTFSSFEAIIWDDCSTDGTWAKMQEVAAQLDDPRFKIFRSEQNLGLSRGLNEALRRTTAEYVAIVGSGDTCHPDRLAKQVAALDAEPNAVFCASASTTLDPLTGEYFSDESFEGTKLSLQDIEHTCPFTHGTVMYRRAALLAVGGYEEAFKWCSDWDLFFRLLQGGNQGIYISEPLYDRIAQPDGASFNPVKSFEQISFKQLALKLSRCGMDERERVLGAVRAGKLNEAVASEEREIARDLARRNIKLYLMHRREAAQELERLASENGVIYPFKYRVFMGLAKRLGRLGVRPDKVISVARALPR